MTGHTLVATANILYRLTDGDARTALNQVLHERPDLVGLQEWYVSRLRLLREYGDVRVVPGPGLRLRRRRDPAYHWVSALAGGTVVGARADRFDLVWSRVAFLSGVGRSDRPDRFLHVEPPRAVTVGVFRDREEARTVCLLSYHLAPGVESRGSYRDDRPLLTARHRKEVAGLERLVAEQQRAGHVVYAVGDSNFTNLALAGLTSAWDGRDRPGTIGSRGRTIDDVHGPGTAVSVRLLDTPSDHRAVLALRTP